MEILPFNNYANMFHNKTDAADVDLTGSFAICRTTNWDGQESDTM
jgi:hypothetical protein